MGWLSSAVTSAWIVRGAVLALGLPLLIAIYRWAVAALLFDDVRDSEMGPVPTSHEPHAA
jgi:hypothetical protein